MKKLLVKIVTWKEGAYTVAQCLNVDVSSFGKTKKEAMVNLDEALTLYFEGSKAPVLQKIAHVELHTGALQYA